MKNLKPKISIIGSGNVGMRYAYALIIKGLARNLVMVDIDKKRLEGEVMDLSHGAPFISPVDITSGDYPDIENSDIVVITAGLGQKPGETRLDLVNKNFNLFKDIIPKIVEYSPDSIYLVASNPVDILSYATYIISQKPSNEIIGSGTVLDTARFRYLLSKHCNINATNVHAYILGEHGDTEFAVWSKAMIGGTVLKDYCLICNNNHACNNEEELNNIFSQVKNSAYEIIERKGETSYGIGLALTRITKAILNDENTILPVSVLIEDYLGINDVYLSLPTILNKKGVSKIMKMNLNDDEQKRFINSAETIKSLIEKVDLSRV
ncbi:MAG: L-lactate dehydrogenase [Candidatus Lokiarchaeota archaeon]|nr:L-lactate dehydrogenase [Candidatus Lokiarchaeota archaeon]